MRVLLGEEALLKCVGGVLFIFIFSDSLFMSGVSCGMMGIIRGGGRKGATWLDGLITERIHLIVRS